MAFTKVAPAGIGSTPGDGYRIGDSFLHSTGVEITNINATGIVTAASLDISGAIDFDGQTNLDHVNIAGVTTITSSTYPLNVHADTAYQGILVNGNNAPTIGFNVGDNATPSWKAGLSGTSHLNFSISEGTGNTNRFTLNSGGGAHLSGALVCLNVGIDGNIYHNSDTDTKLQFGTDTIDLHTGGSIRLRINSSGKLLLGTTTPGYSGGDDLTISTSGDTGMTIRSGTSNQGILAFSDGTSGADEYRGYIQYLHNGDALLFGANATEKFRINSTGQIITNGGSANPYPTRTATFQPASGQTNCYISIVAGNSSSVSGLTFGDDADNQPGNYAGMFEYRHNIDTLAYMQNASDRLRIDASGQITNAGIATSFVTTMFAANFAKLDIRGTNIANSNHYILSYGEGHANDHEFHMVNTLGDLVFRTGSSSPTERFRITTTGGLESYSASDANPNFKFRSDDTNWHGYLNQTVHGATISTILSCGGTWTVDGTTYAATKDYNGSFGTAALIVHNQYNSTATGGELVFVTKANGSSTTDGAVTERLRISSNGDMRIGGGTPSTFGSGTTVLSTYNASTYVANLVTSGSTTLQMIASQTHGASSIGTRSNHNLNLCANDSTKVTIDTAGRLIVGGGTHAGGSALVVKGGNQNSYSTIGMFSNHTNPSSGTLLSQIRFGANATAVGADIRVYADADWGTNDYPTRIEFHTAPDGSNSRQVRLKIDKDGTVNCTSSTALKVPTGTTAERPTGTTGMLRYNTTTEELEAYGSNNFWFNVKDGKFQGEGDIGTASNPAYSGKQLKDLGRSSGNYYIKPQGYSGSAIQAYVDMTTNGGGWVLVAAFPLQHSGLTMSGNTSGLNESSVKNYATTVPSNSNAAFYNKDFINYLFHQNADGDPYSTYSIAGVHGQSGNGYILWEVRANSSNRLSTIDAFKTIYKTNEANNKFDVRYYRNTSNTLNDYVGRVPSDFNSYANYTYGRGGTSDNANNYHYLIDDITTGYQWAFRENSDDNPGNYNGYDLSNIFIR